MNATTLAIGLAGLAIVTAGCGETRRAANADTSSASPSTSAPRETQAPYANNAPVQSTERDANTSVFMFDTDCEIASVDVPASYETDTASHAPCTVWLADDIPLGGRIVVCMFALKHDTVQAARQGRDGFHEVVVGQQTWHVAIPDPYDVFEDSFRSILVLETGAIAAYGVGTGWNEGDLKQFLSGVKPRSR